MQTKLVVSSSPFLRDGVSTRRLMGDVVIALIPTALAAVWFFGAPALALMIVAVAFAVLSELVYERIAHQKSTISDLSAVVTGILLAFNLPVSIPLWMVFFGAVVAIVVVKQMFGGIGQNFVNPALTARIVMMVSFPTSMSTWNKPFYYLQSSTDALTTASPLYEHLEQALLLSPILQRRSHYRISLGAERRRRSGSLLHRFVFRAAGRLPG